MGKQLNILWLSLLLAGSAKAQSAEQDSIKARELNEVVVEAQLQSTSATVSTYIPTSKQKNRRRPQPTFSTAWQFRSFLPVWEMR